MRSSGLTAFERVHSCKGTNISVINSLKIAEVRRHGLTRALPPGKKLDEQVARLEDFFDASWEMSTPTELDEVPETEEIQADHESTQESTPNQLVQMQRFKDSGVHQVNEYARKEAMKLKSVLVEMRDSSSKEDTVVEQAEIAPARDKETPKGLRLAQKLRRDAVELSSTAVDAVSKNVDNVATFGRHHVTTVQSYAKAFSKQHPVVYDLTFIFLGLTVSFKLADAVGHVIGKVFKSKGEAKKQQSARRKKGQRQRRRFQNMLGSLDEGVDTSVFTAVKKIGETASAYEDIDYDDEEELVDRETMTKEMKAAWEKFVKASRLSEGEFWTQDDIDQGLDKIEIEFQHEDDSASCMHDSIDALDSVDLDVDVDVDVDVDIDYDDD